MACRGEVAGLEAHTRHASDEVAGCDGGVGAAEGVEVEAMDFSGFPGRGDGCRLGEHSGGGGGGGGDGG